MTKIEWADETWNPITGCTPTSEGCRNCYAEHMAKRLAGRFGYPKDNPFGVTFHPDRLSQPHMWKKPRRIFVCSMGDLFHERVKTVDGCKVLGAAIEAPHHTYIFLTKRPDIMKAAMTFFLNGDQPPNNWWLGVTAENQEQAEKRIPMLLQIPAAVRFVSVEPMLGEILLHDPERDGFGNPLEITTLSALDWLVVGGESGPGARPMHPGWVRSLRDQCQSTRVPFFFKQWGSNPHQSAFETDMVCAQMQAKKHGRMLDGREWEEYPRFVLFNVNDIQLSECGYFHGGCDLQPHGGDDCIECAHRRAI